MNPTACSREWAPSKERRSVVDKQCIFHIGASWFSLLATTVREVAMAPKMVSVPGSHAALAGLSHDRNEFLPVVQLGPLLGESDLPQGVAEKMLVLGGSAGNWALLVEEVVALESLETLIHPDSRLGDMNAAAVIGTATFREHVVRVLDPNSLYRRAEELLRSCWSNWMQPADDATTFRKDT